MNSNNVNKILMDNIINLINQKGSFNYEVKEKLIINIFNEKKTNIDINIIQNNNSLLIINCTCINYEDCHIDLNVKIKGNNNKCIINFRGIAYENVNIVNVCVNANDNTQGNEIIENLKGLCENGSIIINPILEINTNEVVASHFVTIGPLDQNMILYLESKGISKENVKQLLKKSFMYNIFNDDFISLLNDKEENNE
ncbi:MAG: SufD family Fe-S cluster assembly protein [Bacilli bacterium]